jgi:GDP-4-dehydro-6-deoxy-D-mannose reductase
VLAPLRALGQPRRVRIWVTGAVGFVGSRLTRSLAAGGHDVVGVDREVEITDASLVAERVAAARPDAIVHLAAQSSGARALRAPEQTARVNYFGARAVLEAARRRAPRARVLLVTSGEVYGSAAPGSPPFRESDPLAPGSPYARTKACADLLGEHYATGGLDVVRVRPFNHTGPGQADTFVAASFAHQVASIARGEHAGPLRVGNLDSVRDFLDVEDVIAAYGLLLDPDVAPGPYNVASGEGRRIGDLLADLLALAHLRCEVEVDPERVRPTDHAVGDASRLRDATGWQPRVPWRDTLSRLLASVAAA